MDILEVEQVTSDIKNLEATLVAALREIKVSRLKQDLELERISSRMERMERKLWWMQGICGSAGVALMIIIIRLIVAIKL